MKKIYSVIIDGEKVSWDTIPEQQKEVIQRKLTERAMAAIGYHAVETPRKNRKDA